LIPEPVWRTLLDAFAAAPTGHERVAYLDGVRFRDSDGNVHGVAVTVTVPDAVTTPYNFLVTAQAMARAGEHFSRLGLVRLAQVHTHGDARTYHSPTDDRRAYSQRDGALSVVLANHADRRPDPAEAGVHVREPSGWRRVNAEEISETVRLVPGLIDQRSTTWSVSPTVTKTISEDGSRRLLRLVQWTWRWWSRRRRSD
jgi:hypothetical protein